MAALLQARANSTSPPAYPDLHRLVTPNDHGPAITAAAYFCMTMMLLFLLARVWIRWPLKSLCGSDDWTALVASVLATLQTILVLVAVQNGLGMKTSEMALSKQDVVLKLIYSSSVFYVITLALGKIAMVLLCIRLSAAERQRHVCRLFIGVIAVWGAGSVLVLALRDDLTQPWDYRSLFGSDTLIRWIVIEAFSAVFEVCILAFVIWIIWPLQASRSTKMSVMAGFSFRIPLFGIAIARLYYIAQASTPANAYSLFSWTLPEILTQLEMHYNLIAATIPCLRIFLKAFNSGLLGGVGLDAPDDYGSRYGSRVGTRTAPGRKWSAVSLGRRGSAPPQQLSSTGSAPAGGTRSIEMLSACKHQISRSLGSIRDHDDAASDGSGNPLCEINVTTKITTKIEISREM